MCVMNMIQSKCKLTGTVKLTARHKNGEVFAEREGKNIIVTVGLAAAAGLLNGVITNFFDYIAIGTSATGEVEGNTTLGAETHRELATTMDRTTTTHTNDTARWIKTFSGYGGSETVAESGIFDSASTGIMLNRKTFTGIPIDWTAGDSLQVTWTVQVAH
jgi:hypothetical protein